MELVTFGTPGLRDVGDPPSLAPKNLAVLVFLAVAEPRGLHRRDTLLPVFWPGLDQRHARNALNQVVYQLRRALGEEAVVSHGKEGLGVDPDVVACDAVGFLERLDEGDWESALDLYRGEFLEGFHLSGVPDFERWLDLERRRLRRRAIGGALAAAGEEEAAGDLEAAIGWLRRGREIAPTDEKVARRLVVLLDRAGDRAGAVRVYRRFAARLEAELGLEPSPETRDAIEAIRKRRRARRDVESSPPGGGPGPVRRRGATPAGDAARTAEGEGGADDGAPASAAPGAPRTPDGPPAVAGRLPSSLRRGALVGVVLLVGVAVAGVAATWLGSGSDAQRDAASVAVLPLTDLGSDSTGVYFADGLAADLLDALARIEGLQVAARASSFRFRDTELDVRKIADSLGVETVLEGSVRTRDDRLKLSVQLVDAESGFQLWSTSFERDLEMDALFRVQEEIARSIALALKVQLADDVSGRLARLPTEDLEAYSLFLQAREAGARRTAEGFREALDHYRRAIARDSAFADAWAGLGLLHVVSITTSTPVPGEPREEALRLGRAAVERALALDDDLAEAHVGRGLLLRVEGREEAAESAFRRAIRLQPSNPSARQALSFLLATHGRTEEALEQMRQARLLDPFSMQLNGGLGRFLYYRGRFEEAVEWLRRALEIGPYDRAQTFLPLSLAGAGQSEEAEEAVGDLDPELHPRQRIQWIRGLVAALAGDEEEARRILAAHKSLALRGSPDTAQATTEAAWIHAALGEVDSAFVWFERFEAWTPPELLVLRADPLLAPMRRDPRYRRLVARADPDFPEPVTAPHRGGG